MQALPKQHPQCGALRSGVLASDAARLPSQGAATSRERGLGGGAETWTFGEPKNVLGSLLGLLHFVLFSGKHMGKKNPFPHFWRLIVINRPNLITFRVNRNPIRSQESASASGVAEACVPGVSPRPLVSLRGGTVPWAPHGVGQRWRLFMGPGAHGLGALDKPLGPPPLSEQWASALGCHLCSCPGGCHFLKHPKWQLPASCLLGSCSGTFRAPHLQLA